MCGIVGYLRLDDKVVDERVIRQMCSRIVHRGPDDEGIYVKNNVGLGMRRLSIIDLSTGNQPIANEDDTVFIVFNGEIYNYRELRPDLIEKGHVFKTDSDTEVILHLYEEYSTDCIKYLNGMFAFAIWDGRKKQLFCVRDRLGIKPFYYLYDNKRLIFGSELKTVLVENDIDMTIDFQALAQYIAFEFIPFPATLFNSIKKMPPGHYLIANHEGVSFTQYWSPEGIQERPWKDADAVEELHSLLCDSVRLRLRADVPFGAFLSGGIDSGSVVAMMSEVLDSKVRTFSIGFEDKSYNELEYAGLIAKTFNTDHTEHVLQPSAIDLIEKLVNYMDDPIGDFSIFPTYLVSKMAREKVKVILSGDGGDELFGGYDTYIAQKLFSYYSLIPSVIRNNIVTPLTEKLPPASQKKGIVNKIKRFAEGGFYPESYEHFRWMIHVKPNEFDHIFHTNVTENISTQDCFSLITKYLSENQVTGLNRAMYLDIKTYLTDNILVKVDRMSMAPSLEARVPFLDYRIVEFALSLPQNLKIRGIKTKYILKKMATGILPDKIINKPKQGFSIPMKTWLKGPVRTMMTDMLSYDRLKSQKIFNPQYINRLMTEHLENKYNHSHKLWGLILFQLWMERFYRR